MLIEKINSCTSSIYELSSLRSNALSLSAYETSINKLTTIDAIVTDFVCTVEEMNKHDFCRMNLSEEDLVKMRESVITCAAAVNGMTLNQNDVTAILSVFETQKRMLAVLWQSTAKAYVEPIRSYLSIINTFAANKEEVSNLIKVLGSGAAAEPNAAIVKTLVSNVQKANEITSNFRMGDGVREFLKKVKDGKATFADITEDVSKWIKDHKLGNRIKLSF